LLHARGDGDGEAVEGALAWRVQPVWHRRADPCSDGDLFPDLKSSAPAPDRS